MAGRPRTRERREREARERAGKRATPVDPGTRRRAVERAAEVGSAQAAQEFGIAVATIRSWRRRLKAEPATTDDVSGAEGLRLKAEETRAMSVRALEQADRLLGRGLASEGRNAATTAAILGDRAGEMERAARDEEVHVHRLAGAEAELIAGAIEAFADALGVNMAEDAPARKVWAALLRQVSQTSRDASGPVELEAPEREVEQVRSELRERVRRELRDGLLEEVRRQVERERLERPALPPPSDEEHVVEPMAAPVQKIVTPPEDAEVVDAEPDPWDELPADWKAKYRLDPALGVYEWENACRREAQQTPAPRRPSRFGPDRFNHPALGGP
jgi:hypothetical protein